MLVHSILPPHLLKPVLELDEADLPAWRHSLTTSVFGALTVSRAIAQKMMASSGGAIVFVTATSALQGYPTVSAHAAGKAGIHALAQCLAAELGPRGIRVNCVAPEVIEGATVRAAFADQEQRAAFVASQDSMNATRQCRRSETSPKLCCFSPQTLRLVSPARSLSWTGSLLPLTRPERGTAFLVSSCRASHRTWGWKFPEREAIPPRPRRPES